MSWLGYHTFLLVFCNFGVLVTSDIYKSVMWTTNNPLFSQSGALSRCFGEDLEMRVHLQSSLPIVCPFNFIIMKTLPSKPATGVLYENFWIVYDKPSFDNCDINMTYHDNGDSNKKLLECDSPEALKSFAYSIDFKAKSPANPGIAFVEGRYYYFLATSDGTDGSLNNTRGGHCNNSEVRMKFKVYICRTDIEDEKCQNVSFGEFLCPSDLPEAATISPLPTTGTEAPTTATGSSPLSMTPTTIYASSSTTGSLVTQSYTQLSTTQEIDTNEPIQGKLESEDISRELLRWKTATIVLAVFFVLFIIFAVCLAKRHKKNSGFCSSTDRNKVTPPDTEPQSLDFDKQLRVNYSFNNSSYSKDCEDGKAHYSQMSPLKPNDMPTVDRPNKSAEENSNKQEKQSTKPHSGIDSEQTGNNGHTPKETESGEKRQHEDRERQSCVTDETAEDDNEQRGN